MCPHSRHAAVTNNTAIYTRIRSLLMILRDLRMKMEIFFSSFDVYSKWWCFKRLTDSLSVPIIQCLYTVLYCVCSLNILYHTRRLNRNDTVITPLDPPRKTGGEKDNSILYRNSGAHWAEMKWAHRSARGGWATGHRLKHSAANGIMFLLSL